MSTVIDFPHRDNFDRHQLWDRFERADLFEQYLDLQAQGVSQRQAAKRLQVPRSTLQAWHSWHDTLDICPEVAQFFQSGPGLAFLHRLVLALHLVCVEVGACGIRLVCLLLTLQVWTDLSPPPMGRSNRSTVRLNTPSSTTAKPKPRAWPRTCPAKPSP